jgi:hypothetical protein
MDPATGISGFIFYLLLFTATSFLFCKSSTQEPLRFQILIKIFKYTAAVQKDCCESCFIKCWLGWIIQADHLKTTQDTESNIPLTAYQPNGLLYSAGTSTVQQTIH